MINATVLLITTEKNWFSVMRLQWKMGKQAGRWKQKCATHHFVKALRWRFSV